MKYYTASFWNHDKIIIGKETINSDKCIYFWIRDIDIGKGSFTGMELCENDPKYFREIKDITLILDTKIVNIQTKPHIKAILEQLAE